MPRLHPGLARLVHSVPQAHLARLQAGQGPTWRKVGFFVDRRGKAQRCEGTVGLAQKPREGLVGCGCTGHCVSRGPSCLASRGFPGRGFLCAVPMATPLPRSGPSGPRWAGNARGDDQVLGAAAAAKLGKAVREAPCSASDAGTAREVSISLGNRNCCHGRSCIRKGCIPCLRKSLRLFLAGGREESGLQLGNGFLGPAL